MATDFFGKNSLSALWSIIKDALAGKQDTISDLSTIRSGAAKGATALQSHQNISGKADKTDFAVADGDAHTTDNDKTQGVEITIYSKDAAKAVSADVVQSSTISGSETIDTDSAKKHIPTWQGMMKYVTGKGYLTSHQSLANYLPLSGGSLTGALKLAAAGLTSNPISGYSASDIVMIPDVPYPYIEPTHTSSVYCKELLKWICAKYPSRTYTIFIGRANPNGEGFVIIHIYNTSAVNSDGYPQYSSGFMRICDSDSTATAVFGTHSYNYHYETVLNSRQFAVTQAGAKTKGQETAVGDTLTLYTNAGSKTVNVVTAEHVSTTRTGESDDIGLIPTWSGVDARFATKDDVAAYLPLAGGTMSARIAWKGETANILTFAETNSTWRSGLKYSWNSNTTLALWGAHKNTQFVWHAGVDAFTQDINGTTTRAYDFQVGRNADGVLEAKVGGKDIAIKDNQGIAASTATIVKPYRRIVSVDTSSGKQSADVLLGDVVTSSMGAADDVERVPTATAVEDFVNSKVGGYRLRLNTHIYKAGTTDLSNAYIAIVALQRDGATGRETLYASGKIVIKDGGGTVRNTLSNVSYALYSGSGFSLFSGYSGPFTVELQNASGVVLTSTQIVKA